MSRQVPLNKKGAILIVSLWTLAILSVFAIILGHKVSAQIKLLHRNIDGIKALYIVGAGVERAVVERFKLQEAQEPIYADSFNQPWLNSNSIFKDVQFGEGSYTVSNNDEPGLFGMQDEQAKININKAVPQTLSLLLQQLGLSPENSDTLAAAVVLWRDNPDNKGRFDAIEEILLADDRIKDIFPSMKNYITVYGSGAININTAPEIVLNTVLTPEQVYYITSTRKWFTESNQPGVWFINEANIPTTENIDNIATDGSGLSALPGICVKSSVFKINSSAKVRDVTKNIEAIVEFPPGGDYKFLYWNQR